MEPTSVWTMMAAMLGAQAGKEMLFDAPARKQEAQYQATKTRLSPWTGQMGEPPKNEFGNNLFQAGVTGFNLGQNMQSAEAQKALLEKQGALLDRIAPQDMSYQNAPSDMDFNSSQRMIGNVGFGETSPGYRNYQLDRARMGLPSGSPMDYRNY